MEAIPISKNLHFDPFPELGHETCSTLVRESGDGELDSKFWWNTTGRCLAVLLNRAGYSEESQHRNTLLYKSLVIPTLGRRADPQGHPPVWKSFMTDHFTPVELSWEWGMKNDAPKVRFSFEPIGPYAGTPADSLNQYAAPCLIKEISGISLGCNLTWYEHLSRHLVSFNTTSKHRDKARKIEGHESRIFLAFDILERHTVLKAYMMPSFKAHEFGYSKQSLIEEAVGTLPQFDEFGSIAFKKLLEFLRRTKTGRSLTPEIVAVDCVEPSLSRIKLYYRSQETSFASVRRVLSLSDDETADPLHQIALDKLRALWTLVLGLNPCFEDEEELHPRSHRTAGILYYFEIRSNRPFPTAKVYIPVRHYASSDLSIVQGLIGFRLAQGLDCGTQGYCEAIKEVAQVDLATSRGLHTYIGCSLNQDQVKVTSYIAPRAFK